IQVSDGALLVMLREDIEPYLALTYYVKDIDKVVADIENEGIGFLQKPKDTDFIKKYLFQTPDGFNQPEGPTMLTMSQTDYFKPEKYVNQVCGLFGELAHPVAELDASLEYW